MARISRTAVLAANPEVNRLFRDLLQSDAQLKFNRPAVGRRGTKTVAAQTVIRPSIGPLHDQERDPRFSGLFHFTGGDGDRPAVGTLFAFLPHFGRSRFGRPVLRLVERLGQLFEETFGFATQTGRDRNRQTAN